MASSLLARGLKLSHLQVIEALAETGQIGAAAARLGIAQPAASRLLSEIEAIIGVPVRLRAGRGVVLSEAGQALAERAGRALRELSEAAREVEELAAGGVGQVRIGAVTTPALDIVLPALRLAREKHPAIACDVTVASSDILCGQLAAGRLDLVIGRVPPGMEPGLFETLEIAAEPVALVVRRGHPLAQRPPRNLAEVLDYEWVFPSEASPLAQAVTARLAALGLPQPRPYLATSSFLLTLAALREVDAVAPLAAAVVQEVAGWEGAPFARIEIELGIEVPPFSLLTRRGARPTAAAETILRLIRGIATGGERG